MICGQCEKIVVEELPEGIFHLVDGAYVSGNLEPFLVLCGECAEKTA